MPHPKTVLSSTILCMAGLTVFLSGMAHAETPQKPLEAGDRLLSFMPSANPCWNRNEMDIKKDGHFQEKIKTKIISDSFANGEWVYFFVRKNHILCGLGHSQYGQLGLKTDGEILAPIPILTHIVSVKAGHDTPFAIDEKGQLWTWGDEHPAKGKPDIPQPSIPLYPAGLVKMADNIREVSSSISHTLALSKDGTLLAWGDNQNGQLGDGTTIDREHPVKTDLGALGNRKIIKIGTRMGESFALTDDGSLWNWGQSYAIPAEPNAVFPRKTPVRIAIDNVQEFVSGWGHLLILKRDDTVWIMGNHDFMNTETGKIPCKHKEAHGWHFPHQIAENARQIASGQNWIEITKKDGTRLEWGR